MSENSNFPSYFDELKENDRVLYDYIKNFFGYGNLGSQEEPTMWFVGQEENGGECIDEFNESLKMWDKVKIGNGETIDIKNYYKELEIKNSRFNYYTRFFNNDLDKIETPTKVWKQIINIILSFNGLTPDDDILKNYQIKDFGNIKGKMCSLQLLPLPAPSEYKIWKYGYYKKKCLEDPKEYIGHIKQYRIYKIKDMIYKNKPTFVIFYAWSSLSWKDIKCLLNTDDVKLDGNPIFGKLDGSHIVICYHPSNRKLGNKDEYFINIGKKLRELISK